MIRVAAVGDVHYGASCRGRLRQCWQLLSDKADLLLLAGDLTQAGHQTEIDALISDLSVVKIPVFAVLGNHDYHSGRQKELSERLRANRIQVLEGDYSIVEIDRYRVGIAGIKGFGGGFSGACCTDFGEPENRAFAQHSKQQGALLRKSLADLKDRRVDFRLVLLHYAPIQETLLGEKREIYAFLGSDHLAEAIDAEGADGVFHGHAHYGSERGVTPGGIPVRNVAQPVIRHSYHVYHFARGVGLEARPPSEVFLDK